MDQLNKAKNKRRTTKKIFRNVDFERSRGKST